jgi:sec-independent protein translocase protein TatA
MFDPSAPHIIILLIVVLLLFGSRRLPGAAKSLGESMHIFKKSVSGLNPDDDQPNAASPQPGPFTSAATPQPGPFTSAATTPPALPATQQPFTSPQDSQAAQIEELQRQVQHLQQQSVGGNAGQSNQPF